uniref:UDP-glucuronosyltransferase n=1 Tax=Neogobius melanostomus TaxID=47308 RepID=A0A8C6WI07_9GOBI
EKTRPLKILWPGTEFFMQGVLVVPLDGSSWVNMQVLLEELHSRGHELTVLRPSDAWYIKAQSPFYKFITINSSTGFSEEDISSFTAHMLQQRLQETSVWTRIALEYGNLVAYYEMNTLMAEMVEQMFENETLMQDLKDSNYDLVLADPFVVAGVLLAHRLKLPLVLTVRWTIQGEGHFVIAPSPLSYIPVPTDIQSELTDKMSFMQRVKNMLIYSYTQFQIWYTADPVFKPLVHKYFGPDVHYMELFQAADIWLMRNDFTFEFPRPTMPNVVYMSGFQCKPSRPLSKELEQFVQSSGEHGVIVMTLGTLVAQLPEDITEEIAAAFAQVPQKVIWRYKGKQPSTLAHGGTNGLQEAIYHGVPLLGLPLMFDQQDNFFRMEVRGVAKVLDISTVNRQVFLQALQELLYQPKYRENMKRLSELHRDQPMKPMDKAMFWIEFVMRHRGAKHLITESYKLSKIQYYCIDVAVFLLTLAALSLFMFMKTLTVLDHSSVKIVEIL